MNPLVLCGSKRGASQRYAERLANITRLPVQSVKACKGLDHYQCIVLLASLYAGGATDLRLLLKRLPAHCELLLATVGIADPQAPANIRHICERLAQQLPAERLAHIQRFHLRGSLDYKHLSLKHRLMMAALVRSLHKKPATNKDRAVLATYGQRVDFIDFATLKPLLLALQQE